MEELDDLLGLNGEGNAGEENPSSHTCLNCGSDSEFLADQTTGDYICSSCGFVQDEQIIDTGREWRSFETDAEMGVGDRARADVADEDFSSLGTGISSTNFNSASQSAVAKSLQKYSRFASTEESRAENNLKESFKQMHNLAEVLQIPTNVRQAAKELLKKFESIEKQKKQIQKEKGVGAFFEKNERTFKGLRNPAFMAAILLLASRNEQGGRTLKHFARGTQIDEKDIKKFYKLLLRNPILANLNRREEASPAHQAGELVETYGNKLKLPYHFIKDAREVTSIYADYLEGKRPSSVAGASILLVLYLRRYNKIVTVQDLIAATGMHKSTLRTVYRMILLRVHELPLHIKQPPD
eukprot:TRINITY_DN5822_c0_g1_i1.p1 TRINITY_DN5822_c0_g1~~TRINITY_DN5822_c0_g1_i1.p1  ORF type:complete len:354 (+),score=94.39 TRINITY_DN5822_c0_g1_i1:65-1126(+)